MPVAFIRTDLLADISDTELTALAARVVAAGGDDPVNAEIARAREFVDRYTARYALDPTVAQRFVRDLALYHLYSRFADLPLNRVASYWETRRALRDIRDGKYPDLPLSEIDGDGGGDEDSAAWGSRPRVGSPG